MDRVDHEAKRLAAELIQRVGADAALALIRMRPRGRRRKFVSCDDLIAIADLMVVDGLGVYAAAMRVVARHAAHLSIEAQEAQLRLLVRRFKEHQRNLLAAARERHMNPPRVEQRDEIPRRLVRQITDRTRTLQALEEKYPQLRDAARMMQSRSCDGIGIDASRLRLLQTQQRYQPDRMGRSYPGTDLTEFERCVGAGADHSSGWHREVGDVHRTFGLMMISQRSSGILVVSDAVARSSESSGILHRTRQLQYIVERLAWTKLSRILSIGNEEMSAEWTKYPVNKSMAEPGGV